MEKFIVNKVKTEEYNLEDLCKPLDELIIFPKKMSWSSAWTTCLVHGGTVHAPDNEEENNKLTEAMKPYRNTCADPVPGNLVWLGIKSENYIWYKMNNEGNLSVQNYLNWESTAPFYETYECAFLKVGGKWASDRHCNKKVKLCTACKISGKSKKVT